MTATIKELVPYVKPINIFAEGTSLPVKEREKTISFQDNPGRKFGWPYHLVRTWEVEDSAEDKYYLCCAGIYKEVSLN